MFFKCKHPAEYLMVAKEQTVEQFDADYDHITYHFTCYKCNKPVTIKHAKMIGGVDAFLKRGLENDESV